MKLVCDESLTIMIVKWATPLLTNLGNIDSPSMDETLMIMIISWGTHLIIMIVLILHKEPLGDEGEESEVDLDHLALEDIPMPATPGSVLSQSSSAASAESAPRRMARTLKREKEKAAKAAADDTFMARISGLKDATPLKKKKRRAPEAPPPTA